MLINKQGKKYTKIYLTIAQDNEKKETIVKLFTSKEKMKMSPLEIIKYLTIKVENLKWE